ncbi:hypothetical protein EUX53_15505, partial [Pseudomonas orientalis]
MQAASCKQRRLSLAAPHKHKYLHNSAAPNRNHDAKRVALDLAFDLDLRRPVKPRWPNAGLNP